MSSEKNWQRELTAYIDGELSDAERAEVEAQLAADPKLKALEARLRQTVALVKTLPAPAPSRQLKAQVLSQLDADAAPPGFFSWQRAVPLFAVAAAALLVFVVRGRLGAQDDAVPAFVEEDQVLLAQNMDVVEDLDLAGLAAPEDLEVIEQLKELEVTR
ncbi:MAG: zf-HC2 domain-containing protein [Myxococcaceae bacterium]|jgi:anti-sigma factor RsiW|nr:zf-HC2 domain-containing protein [Myxococcaceae bacterium]